MDFTKLFEPSEEMEQMKRAINSAKQSALQMEAVAPSRSLERALLNEPLEEARKTRKATERTADEVARHTAQHDAELEELRTHTAQHDAVIEELRTQTREARESAKTAWLTAWISIVLAAAGLTISLVAFLR